MLAHAKLSASSSDRWLNCPASVKASEKYENKSSPVASYGTAAHALSEMCLLGTIDSPEAMLNKSVEGVTVDKDMVTGVHAYLDYVRSLKGGHTEIEVRLDFSHIVPDGFGTCDCLIIHEGTLHIIDLKFGHNLVYAENNSQLSLYALGAINTYGFIHDFDKVQLHIVQPRANHFSDWETTVTELNEWAVWVKERAVLALSADAPFNPTAKGCKWCLHQYDCVALRSHVEATIAGDFENLEDIDGQADKVSNDHIKRILDNMDLINGFLKAIQQVAMERAMRGDKIEGYKLVESRKNKAWVNPEKAFEVLQQSFETDDFAPRKICTPTQALKLVGKKHEHILDDLWNTPQGEAILVVESDKRQAVGSACDDFGVVE